jgi:hypothetical protein
MSHKVVFHLALAGCGTIVLCGTVIFGQYTPGNLAVLAAAAEMYEDCPPREMLSEAELAPLLETWDEAVASPELVLRANVLHLIEWPAPQEWFPEGWPPEGAFGLRYANPEILERLLSLYQQETSLHEEMSRQGLSFEDVGLIVPPGSELPADYMGHLASLAMSTFSPAIYDTVLHDCYGGGQLKYLATVYPERTLELLLQTELGGTDGTEGDPNILYHPERKIVCLDLREAFQLLVLLCERSPEAVEARREEVLEFVRRYAKYYALPPGVTPRRFCEFPRSPEGYVLPHKAEGPIADYGLRRPALAVLELLATAEDVYTVQDIMFDPPKNPYLHGYYDEIADVGARILQRLEAAGARIEPLPVPQP